jgi:hypothetical protein
MKLPSLLLLLSLAALGTVPAQDAAPAPAALDFGDFSSSTITTKAWKASEAKDYAAAAGYTAKCIEMFGAKAVEQQKALTAPLTEKEQIFAQWALNDVGTCYFIQGQILEKQGKSKEAVASYKYLVDNLAFAQTWDPKGWFWKPADGAAGRLKALEFDAL